MARLLNDDDFDLDKLRLTPEMMTKRAEAGSKIQPAKRLHPARPEAFIKLPYERTLAAAGKLQNAPLAVLAEVAYQAFKTHRKQVPLANAKLKSIGIKRDAKMRALRRLEAAGLVAVDWRGRGRSPLITLLWSV
jgi:hypothetical protein